MREQNFTQALPGLTLGMANTGNRQQTTPNTTSNSRRPSMFAARVRPQRTKLSHSTADAVAAEAAAATVATTIIADQVAGEGEAC